MTKSTSKIQANQETNKRAMPTSEQSCLNEEQPLKKRLRSYTNHGSPSSANKLVLSHPTTPQNKGKSPMIVESALRGRKSDIRIGTETVHHEINVVDSYQNDERSREDLQHHETSFDPGNNFNIKTNDSNLPQFKSLNVEDNDACVLNSSQFDVASSINGEVKISLICNSSRRSDISNQNLNAVLESMKDKYRKTYGITDSTFSVVKMMSEICECFSTPSNKIDSREPKISKSTNLNGFVAENLENKFNESEENIDKVINNPQSSSYDVVKYPVYVDDISKGQENVEIGLVNDKGAMELPEFFYISKNTVFNNAYVNFSLARISNEACCSECFDDCLSSTIPCACAGETRGEFAYTLEGLVKEKFLDECIAMSQRPERQHMYFCEICPLKKPSSKKKSCKGHLIRKFIKECWIKCGCTSSCGNRVVQRGISAILQVFATPEGKGWGLRCIHPLKKGAFVCEYVGEIVTNEELDERNKKRNGNEHTYPVLLDADWSSERMLKDEDSLCLDATEFGNCARFINHRCTDANLIEIPVEVETPDHHYYHLAFFTTRDVEAFEELTWDYGIQFSEKNHPIKAFKCKCASKFCQGQ